MTLLKQSLFTILSLSLTASPLALAAGMSQGPAWPSNRSGVVFLWETANDPVVAYDANGQSIYSYDMKPHGLAFLDSNYSMLLEGGSYAGEDLEKSLQATYRRTGQMSLEALLTPARTQQSGDLIALATDTGGGVTLAQQNNRLVLRLETSTRPAGTAPLALCDLPTDRPTHIVVTYRPGTLTCYRDGQKVSSQPVTGDLSRWGLNHLSIGDSPSGGHPWRGRLEAIALYSRPLSEAEVRQNETEAMARLQARKPVPQLKVWGKLVAKSKIPTYREIAPYSRALVVYEYAVTRTEGAAPHPGARIRVAHWVMVDRKPLPIAALPVGHAAEMTVQLFEANPQLESEYISDTLPTRDDLKVYYDPDAANLP